MMSMVFMPVVLLEKKVSTKKLQLNKPGILKTTRVSKILNNDSHDVPHDDLCGV